MTIADLRALIYSKTTYFNINVSVTPDGLLIVEGYDGKGGVADVLKYGIVARKVYVGNLKKLGLENRQDEMQQLLR